MSEPRLARGRRLADVRSSGCVRMQGAGWREEKTADIIREERRPTAGYSLPSYLSNGAGLTI